MSRKMVVVDWVHVIAGVFVLASLALGVEGSPVYVSKWFLAFTGFVGFMLAVFGLTGFCPMSLILGACGVPKQ